MLVTGLYLVLRLPLRGGVIIVEVVVLLFMVVAFSHLGTVLGRLILATGKILTVSLLVMLFSLTTQPKEILQFLKPSNPLFQTFQPIIYVISTILAVFPSIQYDLLRAVDSETIRMGKRVMFYQLTSWISILAVTLVRVLNRTERFTDTVIDRGYLSTEGLNMMTPRQTRLGDFLLLLVLIVPSAVLWMVVR